MPTVTLNDHRMYYEIHEPEEINPTLPTVLCTTGWGSFCHGEASHLPRGLAQRYRVIIYDHRGILDSGDNPDQAATMALRADDAIALLDHLDTGPCHLVGIAGMGACICQLIAIKRPDLCASLVNSGAWCFVDAMLRAQLELWLQIHEKAGFAAFQQLVTLTAFAADFYNHKKHKILGPDGGWSALRNRLPAHRRITQSCLSHNSKSELHQIKAPSLIIHMGRDQITSPRLSLPIEDNIPNAKGIMLPDAAHVPTGREQRRIFDSAIADFLQEVDTSLGN